MDVDAPLAILRRDIGGRVNQLRAAETEHDRVIRARYEGVTDEALAADRSAWLDVGAAIADVARKVERACAVSAFGEARPRAERLAVRLTESIDDLVDPQTWAVIEAAAHYALPRLTFARRPC